LIPLLDQAAYNRFYWLIRHGPSYQVWTIASLPSGSVEQVSTRFLTAFRTRLFGFMRDERLARTLAGDDDLSPRLLEQGRQFLIRYTGKWLRFWICNPEDDVQPVKNSFDEKGAGP
jgi:hypothetical protein